MRADKLVSKEREARNGQGPVGKALALECAKAAIDKKAERPVVIDLLGRTGYADWFVLASGTSDRQVVAIADSVRERMREQGVRPLGVEGEDRGQWVLIDFGDVVVHVFQDEFRDFYDLDGLWADAPRVDVPAEPDPR